MTFAGFDTRGDRTAGVRTGYAEWVPTYEWERCRRHPISLAFAWRR